MYAEIHSKTEVDGEPLSKSGKRTWVNDDAPKVMLMKNSPKNINHPPWHIQIEGSSYLGTDGSRDAFWDRATVRTVTVELTPADLSNLLNLALPQLIDGADLQTRKKVAFDILQGLDDDDLLSFLAELLPSRPSTKV